MLFKKRISRLTGFKVSSLVCKCVFYRLEHNTKRGPHGIEFEVFEMQKWDIPTSRTEITDKKMRSFVYLSCLLL